ncbi:Myogenesis-regulating glycosidase [Pseudolycoriella hygida]|uniref:Myogenesis-regulating glycosidase n=1 Tax=Pseudolycoriella hygida TaxID=35572 RepID=A0A9Q0MP63_9DIPT|nr:Myogenesis-regulating glycosidase [Pseudolycoriella hygida]
MFFCAFIFIVVSSPLNAQILVSDFRLSASQDVTHLRIEYSTSYNTLLNDSLTYSLWKGRHAIHVSQINQKFGQNFKVTQTENGFFLEGADSSLQIHIEEDTYNFALISVKRISKAAERLDDCIELKSQEVSWYGGPQQRLQYWPVDKLTFDDYSYVTKQVDNCAIAERYWLNSVGLFIYVDAEAPLFLNQVASKTLCLTAQKKLPYYAHDNEPISFNYKIGIASDARKAHMQAIGRFLKKPSGVPDEQMIRHPIWSTWARYYRPINDSILHIFSDEILQYQFNNSQLEIDDFWEPCYGATEFDTNKFPNMKTTTDLLKRKGFRVTLWVHPFINKVCEPYYTNALNNGYLVLDTNNNASTQWWNSGPGEAAYVDFTKPAAAKWFTDKLTTLLDATGIDSIKFDAGESSFSPADPVLNATKKSHPLAITTAYLNTISAFGSMIEVRSGFRNQHLPVFLRINDKDSDWSWDNGLPTLVTTLLVLNMVGYPLLLPDMIGGNGYGNNPPNKELFLRWLQANVFMPSLQFSFVPWQFDDETVALSRKFTDLHAQYTDIIMERFRLAARNGDPVNPPIWWIDPDDRVAQLINDEFLLGENILVAPVLQEGKFSRDIYLPRGKWVSQTGECYNGPVWLKDYPADLSVLPYFIKSGSVTAKNCFSLIVVGFSVIMYVTQKFN